MTPKTANNAGKAAQGLVLGVLLIMALARVVVGTDVFRYAGF